MDAAQFRRYGKEMVDYIADYLETVEQRHTYPDVEPGYLINQLPTTAPQDAEPWEDIQRDIDSAIMPGITHWSSPNFFAYYPAGQSYPSICGDMLAAGLGTVGVSWASSPACTELEMIVTDWLAKAMDLPQQFHRYYHSSSINPRVKTAANLHQQTNGYRRDNELIIKGNSKRHGHTNGYSGDGEHVNGECGVNGFCDPHMYSTPDPAASCDTPQSKVTSRDDAPQHLRSKGGGVIKNSASDSGLLCMLVARKQTIKRVSIEQPTLDEATIQSSLVVYVSDETHQALHRATVVCGVRCHVLPTDQQCRLTAPAVQNALDEDIDKGLIPFFIGCTFGTTSSCSFDDVSQIGPLCEAHNVWLHIDAAYAGSALICPEYRHLMTGIQHASSFNFNPHKWLLTHFDCSVVWFRDISIVPDSFAQQDDVPAYFAYEHYGKLPELKDFQLGGGGVRFRSLKLWFVLRSYGISGLQKHIRKHCRLAQEFKQLVQDDERFEVVYPVHLGLVCFRIKGECRDEVYKRWLHEINTDGRIHLISGRSGGRMYLRFVIAGNNTTSTHVHNAWCIIRDTGVKVVQQQLLLQMQTPPTAKSAARTAAAPAPVRALEPVPVATPATLAATPTPPTDLIPAATRAPAPPTDLIPTTATPAPLTDLIPTTTTPAPPKTPAVTPTETQ